MEISISHFGIENDLYQECLKLREEVLRRPLGMSLSEKDKAYDADSIHILLMVNGKPAGTVALYGNQLRQMAVSDDFKGQGLGKKLVEYLEAISGKDEIILEARDYAIPFYQKCGYQGYGEFYEKVGMPHQMMKKIIQIFFH